MWHATPHAPWSSGAMPPSGSQADELLRDMLRSSPERRPSAQQVVEHPFFREAVRARWTRSSSTRCGRIASCSQPWCTPLAVML
eukprot:2760823-Prymnesium_polylepis.2